MRRVLEGFASGWSGAAVTNYVDSTFPCAHDPSKSCVSKSVRLCIGFEVPYDYKERYQDEIERLRLTFVNWAHAYQAANREDWMANAAGYVQLAFKATLRTCQK